MLQGDGISVVELDRILGAVLDAGFSAQCVAFGMGSGLLQKGKGKEQAHKKSVLASNFLFTTVLWLLLLFVLFVFFFFIFSQINRDTMSFATKLSHVRYADGSVRDIMKKPKTDSEKISLPGVLKVCC